MANEATESMAAGRATGHVTGRQTGHVAVGALDGFVAGVGETRQDQVSRLSREIRALETAGRPGGVRVSSGSVGMDRCLPGGGYAKGSMLELVHGGMSHRRGLFCGMGLMGLGVRIAKEWISDGRYMVILDRDRQFYAHLGPVLLLFLWCVFYSSAPAVPLACCCLERCCLAHRQRSSV